MTGLFLSKNAVRIFYKYLNQLDVKYVAVMDRKLPNFVKRLKLMLILYLMTTQEDF